MNKKLKFFLTLPMRILYIIGRLVMKPVERVACKDCGKICDKRVAEDGRCMDCSVDHEVKMWRKHAYKHQFDSKVIELAKYRRRK